MQKNTKKDFSFVLCLFSVKAIERSFFRFTGLITHFENTQRARRVFKSFSSGSWLTNLYDRPADIPRGLLRR